MTLVASRSGSCCGGPLYRWCWRVRCDRCRQWVTKHDHTKDDALSAAADHRCADA